MSPQAPWRRSAFHQATQAALAAVIADVPADIVFSVFGLYGSVAENLMQMDASASGQSFGAEEFAKAAVDGWMNSPEHRPQILDPGYNLSGIGVARIGGQAVATQVFHGPPHRQPRTGNSMRRAANARPE